MHEIPTKENTQSFLSHISGKQVPLFLFLSNKRSQKVETDLTRGASFPVNNYYLSYSTSTRWIWDDHSQRGA